MNWPKKILMLKLGGSVLTDKSWWRTARHYMIAESCRGISDAYKKLGGKYGPEYSFIIGHGAGSFGHHTVAKYGLKHGLSQHQDRAKQLPGIGYTQLELNELGGMLMRFCLSLGVPTVMFHPSSFMYHGDGVRALIEHILRSASLDMVPIVHGDIMFTSGDEGIRIMSTEKVFRTIIQKLIDMEVGADIRLGMVVSIDGLMTCDPSSQECTNPELVTEVNCSNINDILRKAGGAGGIDVTGGMAHKVEMLHEMAKLGVETVIFKATRDNIAKFLTWEKVRGTWFTRAGCK